ncbi:MAG: threonylcarbamoyl-AMP synthase [Candidatus Nealsonbacteria bacterium]|nr:threonylcarbamoyl-AMP synthase [Candidatus Nealsonbacteria bacterium]
MAIKIKEIIEVIKKGGVALCPTETVYGLLADATNDKAVERVFDLKKRPKNKAIAVFIKNIKEAKKLSFIDKQQEKFLKEIWPGKVTVILKRRPGCGLSKKLFAGKKAIGLRISSSKLVNDIIKRINKPLTTTSANISGKPASTKIKDVLKQFENQKIRPDLIVNLGNLPESRPSKVIDLTKKPYKVLRI